MPQAAPPAQARPAMRVPSAARGRRARPRSRPRDPRATVSSTGMLAASSSAETSCRPKMFWSVGMRSSTSSSAGSGSGARDSDLIRSCSSLASSMVSSAISRSATTGFLSLSRSMRQLLAAAQVAGALGGQQNQLEAVRDLLDAVFDGDARHARGLRACLVEIRDLSAAPRLCKRERLPPRRLTGAQRAADPAAAAPRAAPPRCGRARGCTQSGATSRSGQQHEGALMGARMRQDRVGRVAHQAVHGDQVEIERARRVRRRRAPARPRLDRVQRRQQRRGLGLARQPSDAVDVVGLAGGRHRRRVRTSARRATQPQPGQAANAVARRAAGFDRASTPSRPGRLAPIATIIIVIRHRAYVCDQAG